MTGRSRASAVGAVFLAAAVFALPGHAAGSAHHGARLTLPASPAVLDTPTVQTRAAAYGWPLRPFLRQHPIRGGFGDPRFGLHQRNFHFGIDIPAAGGTPVYSVAAGTVFLAPDRVAVFEASSPRRRTGFAYWHVAPAVIEHAAVGRGELIGWVKAGWGHLHFAEMRGGSWVNPLRAGALEPYRNARRARIVAVAASPVPGGRGSRIDLTVEAFVPPALPLAGRWHDARLAPTLVRWRLTDGTRAVTAWRTALDYRLSIPPNTAYPDVYAPTTTANAAGRPGRYVVYLARDWNPGAVLRSGYRVEVQVQAQGARATAPAATVTVDLRSLLADASAAHAVSRR